MSRRSKRILELAGYSPRKLFEFKNQVLSPEQTTCNANDVSDGTDGDIKITRDIDVDPSPFETNQFQNDFHDMLQDSKRRDEHFAGTSLIGGNRQIKIHDDTVSNNNDAAFSDQCGSSPDNDNGEDISDSSSDGETDEYDTDDSLHKEVKNETNTSQMKRPRRRKAYCFFCETDVLHFARHLLRHHASEVEVQHIMSLKIGDRCRKIIFNKLRNHGNFMKSIRKDNVVPIRKSTTNEPQDLSTFLPCKFCKGFYKKKYLARHVKMCPHNTEKTKRTSAQADGRSLIATFKENDVLENDILENEMFPMLGDDEIAQVAKNDPLISAFTTSLLKSGDKDREEVENPDRENQFNEQREKRILERWTEDQKRIVLEYFHNHVAKKIAPQKDECIELIEEYDKLFANKSWQKIKIFVVNMYNNGLPQQTKCPEQREKRILGRWTEDQKRIVLEYFHNHVAKKIAPRKEECIELIEEYDKLFANKSWQKIKIFVVNTYNNELPQQTKGPEGREKRILERWTEEQKKIALRNFQNHIKLRTPPRRDECLQLTKEHNDLFANKSWQKLKIFIVNTYEKELSQQNKLTNQNEIRILEPWAEEQKRFANQYFQKHMKLKIPPRKNECLQLIKEHNNLFASKSWQKIKIFIVNAYKKES